MVILWLIILLWWLFAALLLFGVWKKRPRWVEIVAWCFVIFWLLSFIWLSSIKTEAEHHMNEYVQCNQLWVDHYEEWDYMLAWYRMLECSSTLLRNMADTLWL